MPKHETLKAILEIITAGAVILGVVWILPLSIINKVYGSIASVVGLAIYGIAFFYSELKSYRNHLNIIQWFDKKYYIKLKRIIKEELETDAKNKNVTLLQTNPNFIEGLAIELTDSISKGLPPNKYEPILGDRMLRSPLHVIYLGKYGALMQPNESILLAEKMTEISNSKRYRKNKLLFYLFS